MGPNYDCIHSKSKKSLLSIHSVTFPDCIDVEFWKKIPPNEPYRVILGDVRDKLYHTRERARQLLANGFSDVPKESTFTNVEEVC